MSVKTVIGFPNQFAVEALFAPAGLVSRYKQNRLAPRIKGEGHSPLAVCRAESQFLHVGVAGAINCIDARPVWHRIHYGFRTIIRRFQTYDGGAVEGDRRVLRGRACS